LQKVSSQLREYSRFQETIDGDWVRSRLPPEDRSPNSCTDNDSNSSAAGDVRLDVGQ